MTEAEYWMMTPEQRRAIPEAVALEVLLTTRDKARVILEEQLDDNLADKLRSFETELATATQARDAALRDLETVKHLIPRHWIPAAHSARSRLMDKATPFLLAFDGPTTAAEAALAAGCERARALIEKALADHVTGPAADLLALRQASQGSWRGHEKLKAELVTEAVGSVPEGVRPKAGLPAPGWYELVPPPAPPAVEPETSGTNRRVTLIGRPR